MGKLYPCHFFIQMKKHLLIILTLFFVNNNYSQNNNFINETQSIKNFISANSFYKQNNKKINRKAVVSGNDTLFAIFYNSDFFIVYSKQNKLNPILGYSFQHGLSQEQLIEQEKFLKLMFGNTKKANYTTKEYKNTTSETHGPLLESLFGQTNCRNSSGNIINVSNLYTPYNYAVGCVAISLATALHHSKWPIHGTGEHSYTDYTGSSQGTYSANFEETYYNWNNILNKYNYQETSSEQRAALGILAYQSAVAIDMEFERTGSTSNVNKIPNALIKYFKHYGEYKSNTSDQFFIDIDSMIIKNSVVPLAVYGNGYGHSIVCDGWKTDESNTKYYHLNMGWWGTTNGWYQIQNSFNAGGYSSVSGGVFNIVPTPDLEIEYQGEIFAINWKTPKNIEFSGYELQIKKGRANWATLANIDTDTSYTAENDGETSYAFRIKIKYNKFPTIEAWSNMVVKDNTSNAIVRSSFSKTINVYPNPANDILNIENINIDGKIDIKIIDILGKKQKELSLYGINSASINISDINQGSYILTISNHKYKYSQIFIKK